jgi:predicted RecA/RadA family phage recombinase
MNEVVRDLGGYASREEYTCTGATKTGDIFLTGSGKACIVCDTADSVSGDKVAVATDALVLVDSASATTFAAAAAVSYDPTTKLAVASGTGGSIAIGKAEKAKVANELSVLVRLNG